MLQTVIETRDGWMVKCVCPSQWHVFPKQPLNNGAKWAFNGDMEKPTFTPSMNVGVNMPGPHHNPECETWRCHFIVTAGVAHYCGDCTYHAGESIPLQAWEPSKIAYYESLRDAGWA